MESLNKVISSFNLQNTLQPKIWLGENQKMNPKVRQNLLEIAYQFIDSFGLDVVIDDIIVTGSIANYNWSEYSDVDLHILVDYGQFQKEMKDVYVEYFDLKKIVFNQKRNLKMFGFDVEVFVEDSDVKGISGGVYSILNDEWIKKPQKEKFKVEKSEIIKNAKKWMRLIDNLIKHLNGEDVETIRNSVKVIKDKLKKFRVSGLNKGGELGLENLVFKVLRRNGYIEKLYNIPMDIIDKKLSLDEKLKN
jgi:predicted nucleotidyltransferase